MALIQPDNKMPRNIKIEDIIELGCGSVTFLVGRTWLSKGLDNRIHSYFCDPELGKAEIMLD